MPWDNVEKAEDQFVDWVEFSYPKVQRGTPEWMEIRLAWMAGFMTCYLHWEEREEDA